MRLSRTAPRFLCALLLLPAGCSDDEVRAADIAAEASSGAPDAAHGRTPDVPVPTDAASGSGDHGDTQPADEIEIPDYAVYQRAENARGDWVEARVARGGSVNLHTAEGPLTTGREIAYDPAISPSGRIAYALNVFSNEEANLWLDGAERVADGHLNYKLRFSGETLLWISVAYHPPVPSLCTLDHTPDATPRCIELGYFPFDIRPAGPDHVAVAGFDPAAGASRFAVFHVATLAVIHDEHLDGPSAPVGDPEVAGVVTAVGDPFALRLFWALRELHGPQRHGPFALGSDVMGRLAWNESYRLRALALLAPLVGEDALRPDIRRAATWLLAGADDQGLYPSEKYAFDRQTPVVLAVNHAFIAQALLAARPYLTPRNQSRALAAAEVIYDAFEPDWHGEYIQTPCAGHRYDGLPMPFNMQNAMGLWAIDLFEATADPRYRQRAQALYDNFVAALVDLDGDKLWHYWPPYFYEGWTPADRTSCNTPTRAPSTDSRLEDYAHAAINAEFALRAAALLELPPPINIDALAARLQITPWTFARHISGATDRHPPSYAYLPYLSAAPTLADRFAFPLATPDPDFDRQGLLLEHTRAAAALATDTWQLTVTTRTWDGSALSPTAERTFCQSPSGCTATPDDLGTGSCAVRLLRALGR